MDRGISGCDVVVAVISRSYCKSKNCGHEMELVHKYQKDLIPLMFGFPENEWPPNKIGDIKMTDQFRDSSTGDMRLYINFTDIETVRPRTAVLDPESSEDSCLVPVAVCAQDLRRVAPTPVETNRLFWHRLRSRRRRQGTNSRSAQCKCISISL